jgi:hypothetical protein
MKPDGHRRYENWNELMLDLPQYDRATLRKARLSGCPGFAKSGYRVDWTLAEPWMKEHITELATPTSKGEMRTLEDLRKEKVIVDIENVKLKNKELQGLYLNPEDVKQFLVELATAQSVMLKKIFSELPPRLTGLDEPNIKLVLDKSLVEIFELMKNRIDKLNDRKI